MMNRREGKKSGCLLIVLLFCCGPLLAQQIRLDNLKEQYSWKNAFRMNGGFSANMVSYNGSNTTRDPFTWILSGNINLSFFNQFNLPFSFNLNNLGGNYTYPTMPNRFSLHPTYKWIFGHIGDVAMSFSPYTLSGHQFTGVGVDLSPEQFPLKISAMFGRLLKATEYNPNEQVSMPTYDRWGYGARVIYDKEKYLFGMTFFQAKDNETSLSAVPDSLPVFPQSNTAMSWEVGLKLIKNLSLSLEYGISFLNRDNRTVNNTSVYHAVKVGLTYQILSNTFGFGYERIDPGYQSLGAYYFTNDLQNFTLNFSRPFFQEKLNLAFNVGFQHDNLDGNKTEASKRFVGAVNLNYNHNEHLNAAFTYSNFQTFTNVKSQFDYINAVTNYDNRDTLNYTQLSQNAGLNVTYNFGGNAIRKHSLGINFNFQEAADKKGDAVCTGGASQLYNMAANYSLLFVPQNIQLTASSNLSYNTVATNNTLTYGNSIGANAKLFDKFIAAGMVLAYNLSYENGQWQNSVVNIKGNIGCQLFQRHGLNLQLLVQTRNMHLRAFCNDFTATFSYVYTF